MSLKANLTQAKTNKKDEFYTQLKDIENELRHYKEHFKGKTVYCNADDPRVSNFFHYFSYNFEHLGLKKLITTCYKNQEMDLFSMHDQESAIALIYEGEKDNGRVPTVENIGIIELNGDGDFRSPEAIEFLKEADIVVTNPPFSLFREYVDQLIEYEKDFIIIGHQNAITYKETFPLLKNNKMWLGYGFKGGYGHFINKESENYTYQQKNDKLTEENVTFRQNINYFSGKVSKLDSQVLQQEKQIKELRKDLAVYSDIVVNDLGITHISEKERNARVVLSGVEKGREAKDKNTAIAWNEILEDGRGTNINPTRLENGIHKVKEMLNRILEHVKDLGTRMRR